MDKDIHIVCLDAPSPPVYGAAVDMYYKIIALASAGARIRLHYFSYNNRNHAGLEQYCTQIYSYQRKTGFEGINYRLPYIVASRINRDLVRRLDEDNYPVLLEGVHCAGIIPYFKNRDRRIVIRLHNDEASYYRHLSYSEKNWFRKIYDIVESRLLHQYQKQLPKKIPLAAVAGTDIKRFSEKYHFQEIHYIPSFFPWQKVTSNIGSGTYCLYHGNMRVSENEEAVLWLVNHIIPQLHHRFVIAGSGISSRVKERVARWDHVQLVESPDDAVLEELIQDAHINLIPSFNATGLKLKLLHALFSGRFCITNLRGVAGSNLESEVVLAESTEEYVAAINRLFLLPFTGEQIERRRVTLQRYNNEEKAAALSSVLYLHYH